MGRRSPGSLRSLRERNRLQVLEVVRGSGSVSRADIARRTGLARSTVSTLVNELLRAGLLVERGAPDDGARRGPPAGAPLVRPGRGRRDRHALRPPRAARRGRRPAATRSSPRRRRESTSTTTPQDALDAAVALVDEVLATSGVERERLLGAGAALAGPIDRRPARSAPRRSCPAGSGCRVAQELEARLGLPVHVDNDANVGALAESVSAPAAAPRRWRTSCSGSGIGAGLIIGGRLYRGARGTAGEIGHVLVDEHGPDLPVRQPRLPGDVRRRGRPRSTCSAVSTATS